MTQAQNIAVADGVAATVQGEAVETPDTEIQAEEELARAFVFDPGVELSPLLTPERSRRRSVRFGCDSRSFTRSGLTPR